MSTHNPFSILPSKYHSSVKLLDLSNQKYSCLPLNNHVCQFYPTSLKLPCISINLEEEHYLKLLWSLVQFFMKINPVIRRMAFMTKQQQQQQ